VVAARFTPAEKAWARGVTVIKFGDWEKADRDLMRAARGLKPELMKAVVQEAHFLRGKMTQGIRSGAPAGKRFKALSPLTLIIRRATGRGGGGKILIQSGTLSQSIVVVQSGNTVFVGVRRGAAKGANIAEIHEGGKTFSQAMTARQRRFIFAQLRKAGHAPPPGRGGSAVTVRIRIPARPFIGPIIEKWGTEAQVKQRVAKRLAAGLGGAIGRI
jgi:phage gpG-like protein